MKHLNIYGPYVAYHESSLFNWNVWSSSCLSALIFPRFEAGQNYCCRATGKWTFMVCNGKDLHGCVGEDGAKLKDFGIASDHLNQFLPEAVADHAVEQEVGGGVEVVQHVGHVPSHIDGNAVVISVEALVVVLGPQDAVRDKARQTEDDEDHRDGAQQEDGPLQHSPCAPSMHDTLLLLGEQVAGTAQVIANQVVEENHQNYGDSTREE